MVYYTNVTVLPVIPSSFEISMLHFFFFFPPKAMIKDKEMELSIAAFERRLAMGNTLLR